MAPIFDIEWHNLLSHDRTSVCARNADKRKGTFYFARCDFNAFDAEYQPAAPDILRMYSASEYEHAIKIHAMLTGRGYTPTYHHEGGCDWVIKYQGKRAVKSTPLFQFEYFTRHAR